MWRGAIDTGVLERESERAKEARRSELAAFLRQRRLGIRPEDVGLTRGERRHTPGLRREEVAELSAIGVGWYTWLEQGRPINVSTEVLVRLARALRLNVEESRYLFRLADKLPLDGWSAVASDVPPALHSMLEGFVGPGSIVNARFDHVVWNGISGRIYDFARSHEPRRLNLLWRMFCDPLETMSRRLLNFDEVAENVVGMFRSTYVAHDAAFFGELLDELRTSPQFCRMWSATNVGRPAAPMLRLRLDDGALLQLYSIRFQPPELPGLTVFMQSPADDDSRAALERLR
jgi:transcriptional regulator with XRE-family HTH domain